MSQLTTPGQSIFFQLKYSVAIRIWHWLTFLFIAGSIVTVLFATTLFDEDDDEFEKGEKPRTEQQTKEEGFDFSKLTPEQKTAFKLSHKIWDAHELIGFGLCFLLLSRVVIEVRQQKGERLLSKIHSAIAIPVSTSSQQQDKKHYLLVKRGYLIFYLLLIIMSATGLLMTFDDVEIIKPVSGTAKGIHSFCQYLMYAYILIHIAGVIRADLTRQKGIVSAMINGGEQ